MQIAPAQLKTREQRLQWYGRLLITGPPGKKVDGVRSPSKRAQEAPKKRWRDVIKRNLAEVKNTTEDAIIRTKWERLTRKADPARRGNNFRGRGSLTVECLLDVSLKAAEKDFVNTASENTSDKIGFAVHPMGSNFCHEDVICSTASEKSENRNP
uniref:Reverse transcriptase n=1 Tax=Haemonchus contortus TaxID=6289 RepID=A0A7I4YAJ5_HAECO